MNLFEEHDFLKPLLMVIVYGWGLIGFVIDGFGLKKCSDCGFLR